MTNGSKTSSALPPLDPHPSALIGGEKSLARPRWRSRQADPGLH
jgi:hypothetical protein